MPLYQDTKWKMLVTIPDRCSQMEIKFNKEKKSKNKDTLITV